MLPTFVMSPALPPARHPDSAGGDQRDYSGDGIATVRHSWPRCRFEQPVSEPALSLGHCRRCGAPGLQSPKCDDGIADALAIER